MIGADQEPATLNFLHDRGNSYTTALAVNPVLAPGAYNRQPSSCRSVSGTIVNTNQGSTWNVQSWTVRAA